MQIAEDTERGLNNETFVMVPSYNHAGYIETCLRSIFRQTRQPVKLLVIDDGSTDGSPSVIEKVLKECPFDSELIVRANRGLCATLNEGFAQSFGEYFAYIGSDDLWLKSFIEERTKLLNNDRSAVLGYGNALFLDENDEIFESSEEWWNFIPDACEMLRLGIAPISSTVFYRRQSLEEYRWNEESKLEDYEFYIRLLAEGEFAFDERVLSVWRHHGKNVSGDLILMLAEVLAAQDRNKERLGLTDVSINGIQQKVKFRFARDLLQKGRKSDAFKLALKNSQGADSIMDLFKFSVRMLVPMKVIKHRRKFRRAKMKSKYSINS